MDDFGASFGPPWPPSEPQNVNISIVKAWFFMKSQVRSKIIIFSIFAFLGGPWTDFSTFFWPVTRTLKLLWGALGIVPLREIVIFPGFFTCFYRCHFFCIFSFKKQISTENPNQKSIVFYEKACENNKQEFWSKNMMLGPSKTWVLPGEYQHFHDFRIFATMQKKYTKKSDFWCLGPSKELPS